MPPQYTAPTTQRGYYPTPAYQPAPSSTSSALTTAGKEQQPSTSLGFVDWALDGLKDKLPELSANVAATRSNFSELGVVFRRALRAPLSLGVTIVAAAVNAWTRGEGPVGEAAGKIAVGAAHATIADFARPKAAADPVVDALGEADASVRLVAEPSDTPD